MFKAGYLILFAALTVIVKAQENPSLISAVDEEPAAAPVLLRRQPKQDDSPPPALRRPGPASSGGSWGSLLSGNALIFHWWSRGVDLFPNGTHKMVKTLGRNLTMVV